jgi:PAS domain S-box-containing protein
METLKPTHNPSQPFSSSEMYGLMLESMLEGVCCLDMQGCITYLNRAAARMLQADPIDLIGQNCHEAMHQSREYVASSRQEDCPICRNIQSVSGAFVNHEVFWRSNGTSFPVEYSVQPLINDTGACATMITFSDITRRQIQAHEMLYILTAAKCLLWYADVQYVRSKDKMRWFLWPADPEAAQRFLPFPVAEEQSFAQAFYACRLEEDKAVTDDYGRQEILAGRNYHHQYRCRRIDGEICWIAEDVQIEPVSEDRWRAVGVCTDITELKRREQEIEVLNERLRRAIQETHHRVKNNLQVIAALIELQTIDEPQTLPRSEFIRLSRHVRSLASIHDLLTAETRTKAHPDSLSARAIFEQLLTSIERTIGSAQLRYELDDARLTNHQCAALALITNELIANAMKHGRAEIYVRFAVSEMNAVLEVCDDGPGFPADFSPRLAANTGLELIENLTRKDLAGQTHYANRIEGGARVLIQFPLLPV